MTRPEPAGARTADGPAGAPAVASHRADGAPLCRVTVLAPRTRMDLALPTDLALAELVPMLCELAGEVGPRSRGGPPTSWCLAAVAGAELPARATLATLGVLDGDLLRLRPRAEAPPPPVFDDPVDAVAEAVPGPDAWGTGRAREPWPVRPWDRRWARVAGLAAAVATFLLAAVLLAAVRGVGPGADPVAAVVAGLAAVGALGAAGPTARTDPAAAAVLAAGAVPLAAAAGAAGLPGTPGAGHALVAAGLAAAAAAVGLALLDDPPPMLVAAVPAAVTAALGALLATLHAAAPSGLAAGAAALAVAALPMLPKLSVRLAGLPPPVVPTTPEEMLTADARWQAESGPAGGAALRHHARLAHHYLGGLVLGAAVVAAAGAVLAAASGRLGGGVFAAVVVAVLLLRSRAYATALASTAPLLAGLLAGAALAAGLATAGPAPLRLAAALGLLGAGTTAVALVRTGSARESSPVARRMMDVVEAALVVATFPLALWVLDLYHVVQGL